MLYGTDRNPKIGYIKMETNMEKAISFIIH